MKIENNNMSTVCITITQNGKTESFVLNPQEITQTEVFQ